MRYSNIDFGGKTMAILMVFRVAWSHSVGRGGYSKGLKARRSVITADFSVACKLGF